MHALTNQPKGYEASLAVAATLIDLHLGRRPLEVLRRHEEHAMLGNIHGLFGKIEGVAHA